MRRVTFFVALLAAALGVGGFAFAQDTGTPSPGGPDGEQYCATPVAETDATPAMVVTAPATAGTPGGVEPGTPIGLFPCGTPVSESSPATDQGPAAGGPIAVSLVDIAFDPPQLTIAANTDVTVTATNNGVLPHTFTVEALGVDTGEVAPGETREVTINAPAGTYEYICTVPGHKEAGMVGTLTVQ